MAGGPLFFCDITVLRFIKTVIPQNNLAAKVLWELAVLRHRAGDLGGTARLLRGVLRRTLVLRVVVAVAGIALVLLGVWPAAVFVVAGELIERRLFFTAVTVPRMPGLVT